MAATCPDALGGLPHAPGKTRLNAPLCSRETSQRRSSRTAASVPCLPLRGLLLAVSLHARGLIVDGPPRVPVNRGTTTRFILFAFWRPQRSRVAKTSVDGRASFFSFLAFSSFFFLFGATLALRVCV